MTYPIGSGKISKKINLFVFLKNFVGFKKKWIQDVVMMGNVKAKDSVLLLDFVQVSMIVEMFKQKKHWLQED